eukprot:686602-Prymnesium_polylepis.1
MGPTSCTVCGVVSLGYQVIRPSGPQVIGSSGHRVIRASGHQVISSSGEAVHLVRRRDQHVDAAHVAHRRLLVARRAVVHARVEPGRKLGKLIRHLLHERVVHH